MTRKEALQQRKELLSLIEQWTRAEIIARLGRFDNLEFADYARIQIDKKDEIRQLAFGESELVILGERWGLVKPKRNRKKKRRKQND